MTTFIVLALRRRGSYANHARSMQAEEKMRISRYFKEILVVAIVITTICLIIPFQPQVVNATLDSSWKTGMDFLVSHQIEIGKDAIFTFGPYASLYHNQYTPSISGLFYGGCAWFLICFLLVAIPVVWRCSTANIGLFFLLFSCVFVTSRDAICYSFFVFYILASVTDVAHSRTKWRNFIYVCITSTALSLLFACKSSFIIPAIASWAGAVAIFASRRQLSLAAAACFTPFLGLALAWAIAGQPLLGIGYYFVNALAITSGYTEAMSSDGDFKDLIVYGAAALAILISYAKIDLDGRIPKLILLLTVVLSLFLGVKAGFVRHDAHAYTSSAILLLTALCIGVISKQSLALPLSLAAAAAFTINYGISHSIEDIFFDKPLQTYSDAAKGIFNRLNGNGPSIAYAQSMKYLNNKFQMPLLAGKSDIYTNSLNYLFASGNTWQPRVVIQSYQSYGGFMNEDAGRLREKDAPDNIFLRIEPIDWHPPLMELGPSLLEMLSRYESKSRNTTTLLIQKRIIPLEVKQTLIGVTHAKFGEAVRVPGEGGIIFAKIKFERSLLSKITTAAFKAPGIEVDLTLAGGALHHRIIPSMTENGFVISPAVETLTDLTGLFAGDPLESKIVRLFKIDQKEGIGRLPGSYEVSFYAVTLPDGIISSNFFEHFKNAPPSSQIAPKVCDGNIETLNNNPIQRQSTITTKFINVKGWMAADAIKGKLAEEVFLTLKSKKTGQMLLLKAQKSERPDVAAYFQQSGLKEVGFDSYGFLDQIPGLYTLSIALKLIGDEKIYTCNNLESTIDKR